MKMKAMTIGVSLALLASAQAAAYPSVFLAAKKNETWWTAETTFVRPLAKSVDGITLERLNAFRAERWPDFDKL